MHAGELRALEVFGGLTDDQLTDLIAGGTEIRIEPGTELFREGEHADYWWVLLDGAIDLIRHIGREDTVVGRMDVPGRWAGGFRAWDEHGVYLATGRVAVTGRVLQLPATELRTRINAWFPFGRHLIEGLYRTARSIESTARQREALVTLGTLAAGLAHEINNPAAAAARAVDSLAAEYQTLTAALSQLATGGISPAQLAALDALRRELETGNEAPSSSRTRSLCPTARTCSPTGSMSTAWTAAGRSPRRWPPPGLTPAGATAPPRHSPARPCSLDLSAWRACSRRPRCWPR